ncbi:hypothetical protein Q3G72_023949 [Acer saccharum]|nr:hypothetical protein Q3G72_023949 [Acer saccharum]
MPVNLTPNAIAAINGGDVNSKPLVQVLDIKLIGSTQERYRLLIWDSAASQHAMLATQLNDRVKTGAVKKGSVVQLIDYICSTVQNHKIIVVLNMETTLLDCEIIGNPKMFTESESTAQKPMPNANLGNPMRVNNFSTPNSSTFNTSNSGTFGGQNPSTFNYGEDADDHEAGTNASAPLSEPGANASAPLSKPGANASAPLSEAQVEEANMGEDEAVPAGPHESKARCHLVVEAREAGLENVTPLPGAVPEATTISSNPVASSRPGASSGVPGGTFAPREILEAMTSGQAYVGEDIWSRLRVDDFSQRLNNVYNSSVYMVSELADVLKTNRVQAETIKRLEASLKESEERRLSSEWACEEKLRVNQETVDSHLAACLKAEQRASVAEENARALGVIVKQGHVPLLPPSRCWGCRVLEGIYLSCAFFEPTRLGSIVGSPWFYPCSLFNLKGAKALEPLFTISERSLWAGCTIGVFNLYGVVILVVTESYAIAGCVFDSSLQCFFDLPYGFGGYFDCLTGKVNSHQAFVDGCRSRFGSREGEF